MILQADVSNETELESVLNKLRMISVKLMVSFMQLGCPVKGCWVRKTRIHSIKCSYPRYKAHGCCHLTGEDNLDFFIKFSSTMTLTGVGGQGDYTAANSFLDTFAFYRKKTNKPSLTIKWPAWKETGMAVSYGATENNLFDAIETKTALEIFERVLGTDLTLVGIGILAG